MSAINGHYWFAAQDVAAWCENPVLRERLIGLAEAGRKVAEGRYSESVERDALRLVWIHDRYLARSAEDIAADLPEGVVLTPEELAKRVVPPLLPEPTQDELADWFHETDSGRWSEADFQKMVDRVRGRLVRPAPTRPAEEKQPAVGQSGEPTDHDQLLRSLVQDRNFSATVMKAVVVRTEGDPYALQRVDDIGRGLYGPCPGLAAGEQPAASQAAQAHDWGPTFRSAAHGLGFNLRRVRADLERIFTGRQIEGLLEAVDKCADFFWPEPRYGITTDEALATFRRATATIREFHRLWRSHVPPGDFGECLKALEESIELYMRFEQTLDQVLAEDESAEDGAAGQPGDLGGAEGAKQAPAGHGVSEVIHIDEEHHTIKHKGILVRFGGVELWNVFIALWKNRPNPVDIGQKSGRAGNELARELREFLRTKGVPELAEALKNQFNVGYYFDVSG